MSEAERLVDRFVDVANSPQYGDILAYEVTSFQIEIAVLSEKLQAIFAAKEFALGRHRPADYYFGEKLHGLKSFTLMAIGAIDRESYDLPKILDNVSHYAYLVKDMAEPDPFL